MAANRILAEIARRGGGKLLNRVLPATGGKTSLLGGIAGTMAVRIATRSVPGAIVVGGALLAKKLHDRRRKRDLTDISPNISGDIGGQNPTRRG